MLYFIVNEKARSGKGARIWHEVQTVLHEEHIKLQGMDYRI